MKAVYFEPNTTCFYQLRAAQQNAELICVN